MCGGKKGMLSKGDLRQIRNWVIGSSPRRLHPGGRGGHQPKNVQRGRGDGELPSVAAGATQANATDAVLTRGRGPWRATASCAPSVAALPSEVRAAERVAASAIAASFTASAQRRAAGFGEATATTYEPGSRALLAPGGGCVAGGGL